VNAEDRRQAPIGHPVSVTVRSTPFTLCRECRAVSRAAQCD